MDLALLRRPDVPAWREIRGSRVEWSAMWQLVLALSEVDAMVIFLDYQAQRRLYRAAVAAGASEAELDALIQYPRGYKASRGLVRHASGHEHHMHVRPNRLPHERRNPVRNASQRRRVARPLHECPVQIHAVIQCAVPRPRGERGRVQHRHQEDPPQHVFHPDLAQEPLDCHRPFVLIAVIGAKRHQALARPSLRSHEYRERNQMVAPQRIVLQRDPVVAPAGGFKIEIVGADDRTCHGSVADCETGKIGLSGSMNRQHNAEII